MLSGFAGKIPVSARHHHKFREPHHAMSFTPAGGAPLQDLQHASFQTPTAGEASDGDSSIDAEELEEVQELLAEKDEELAGD